MIKAVIFDLDGVLVSTDDCHYEAWLQMAREEGIPFDKEINKRLRGVSRMDCLDIILEKSARVYTEQEKLALAERKNSYYMEKIGRLTSENILPGAKETVLALKENGIKVAVGSASKNTPAILKRLALDTLFDAVADGNGIKRGKPDPEVFLLAAKKMGVEPEGCLVVEDADSGVEAAVNGNMKALGVGTARFHPKASISAIDLSRIDLMRLIREGKV